MKTCTKCHIEKELDEFGAAKGNKDGKRYECKQCRRVKNPINNLNRATIVNGVTVSMLCLYCDRDLPAAKFHKDKYKSGGLQSGCAQCKRGRRKPPSEEAKRRSAEYHKKWVENNRERSNSYKKKWRESPQGKAIMRNHKHTRRTLQKQGDITPQWLQSLLDNSTHCDRCCTELTTHNYRLPTHKNIDHIIPINVGGTHTMSNVRILCHYCNVSRPKDGRDLKECV